MQEDAFVEKVDLPGQSDIFESVSCVGSANGQLSDATSQQEFTGLKKQISFLNDSQIEEKKYNGKIEAPIYYPREQKPHIMLLCDQSKTNQLIREINDALISDGEKAFLIAAAWRHAVFHYERIADYYAHASTEMRKLMEKSALIIVDFDSAIESGFVNVCEEIMAQYFQEYRNGSDDAVGDSSL